MVPSVSAKSVPLDLSLPPLPNSAFWRPFGTQEVRPAAAVHAPRLLCSVALPYYCTAARRAYLVVPEIGVLKWFLKMRSNDSVNLKINGRF